MASLKNLSHGQNTALLVFSFLQADCRSHEYCNELLSLGKDLSLTRVNKSRTQNLDDGLETDGHLPCKLSLEDIHPSVELLWPRDYEEAGDIQAIAQDLRNIADRLEQDVVTRATENLSRNISVSSSEQWRHHLTQEVDRVMREGVGLEHLPQERVIMALTLTLVKGVCERAPRLLRSLFNTALQYITAPRAR